MTQATPLLPSVLAMRPRYVEKLWAGSRLRALAAKAEAPPPPRTGESWEVADLPEGCSTVDGGAFDGMPLRAVAEKFARDLVGGRARPGADGALRFPLLVKLIDAGDDLSVQVHPDAAYAAKHPGAFAKDEAWLVVAADDGARVLHGFKDGVTERSFRDAIAAGKADELLRAVRVSVGDVLRIAPGTMHGVGKGCLLLEVQEPSDTTFRVWDYGRKDVDGKPRKLHVEEALAVARFGPQDPPIIDDARPGRTVLKARRGGVLVGRRSQSRRADRHSAGRTVVSTASYGMTILAVDGERALDKPANEPLVVFALKGAVRVDDVDVREGASAIVTARADGARVRSDGPAMLVVMSTGRRP